MHPYWIYLIGIVVLGIFQELVRAALNNDLLTFIILIVYLLALRFIARTFGRPRE